ncbi:hypothetical protein LJK87_26875 [Paenibacillus sp. P25]|nr:hypothetical protein LJK87_26875 [Paenibacillus sp. P25]
MLNRNLEPSHPGLYLDNEPQKTKSTHHKNIFYKNYGYCLRSEEGYALIGQANDRWTNKEYPGIAAFSASTRNGGAGIISPHRHFFIFARFSSRIQFFKEQTYF